jgi:transcription-repair coupling factor (superfamily II helicase)
MTLPHTTHAGNADPGSLVSRLSGPLKAGADHITLTGLKGSSPSFLLACLWREHPQPLLVITPTLEEAEEYREELLFFLAAPDRPAPDGNLVTLYPPDGEFPFTASTRNPEQKSQQLEILHRLLRGSGPFIVVAPAAAMVRKTIPRSVLERAVSRLKAGAEIDREALSLLLVRGGYLKVGVVEDRGDYSIRGGIIDIFPPASAYPIRVELFGDCIESIRAFDAATQRSRGELAEAWVAPVSDAILEEEELAEMVARMKGSAPLQSEGPWEERAASLTRFQTPAELERFLPFIYAAPETIIDYLPARCAVFLHDHEVIRGELHNYLAEAEAQYAKGLQQGHPAPPVGGFYLSPAELDEGLQYFQRLSLDTLGGARPEGTAVAYITESNEDIRRELLDSASSQGMLSPLVGRLREWEEEGFAILIICHAASEARKLIALLDEYGIAAAVRESEGFDHDGSLFSARRRWIQLGSFTRGFRFPQARLIVITEEEIFGEKRRRPAPPRLKSSYFISDFGELEAGDCVVHVDHGVGIYRGLKRLEVGGESSDYLLIEYQGNDRLYLPIDRVKLVQKYRGADGAHPPIDRLGGTAWKRTKSRVKTSLMAMAKELLDIYASRKLLQGHSFSSPDHYYREFEATFPYEETPDQLAAIEDVMRDMNDPKPMDRLICGDVGYGKTEVAVRSSFRAAMEGKQVAFLVPTTVLAQQHYQTITDRLKPYPIRVEMLSRFRSRVEQKEILKGLEDGSIDIIVGTHRLIQKDVQFKDLGLVIIDEEQRFGVAHKERLKKMRKTVDVLTLTATPIPRTLHMSMVGVRDMSMIDTPPEDRLAIRTYITRFDGGVIREAITRELSRGGQIFFVHDRVRTIPAMARYLSGLIPEAKLGVAHGQMSERQLEKVMLAFINREINLLLCTTIIESGLDIPSANTMIVNRADRLGLAQLYQLRGRVGRSKFRAYCYLLTPGEEALSRDARERLQAIYEFSELGSSLRLATRDLEIRGAGNMLGASQSGHIAAVGLDLYTQLMEEAIKELKGETVVPDIDPEIALSIPAFIPEDYLSDINQRLLFYKKLASCPDDAGIDAVGDEMVDRFGKLPPPAANLLRVMHLKTILRRYLITRIAWRGKEIVLTFHPEAGHALDKILALIAGDPKRYRLSPQHQFTIVHHARDWQEVVDEVSRLLG